MDNNEFQEVLKAAKLSEKTYKFFYNLVNPKSETCGDIIKSYHAAGYKKSGTSKYYAYTIYNSDKFQKVLTIYRENKLKTAKNREFTLLERTTEDLNFIIDRSKKGGDLSTMRQAVMDRAKLHGLLIERHQVIDPKTEENIDKTVKIEAAKLAESRLLNAGKTGEKDGENIIDAEFCTTKEYNAEPDTPVETAEAVLLSD